MTENNPTPTMVKQWLQRLINENGDLEDGWRIARYGAYVASVIEKHTQLPRAMDHARTGIARTAEQGGVYPSGTVVLADRMLQPRGRFTRVWHAPPGGIWGCLVTANALLQKSNRFVPFALGVACCETLINIGCEGAKLRWVNDVLIDGKKVAGFLVESYREMSFKEEFTLAGFGINVNNQDFPDELLPTASSLRAILGFSLDITEVTAQFLGRLAWYYGVLMSEEERELQEEGFSGKNGTHLLLDRWLMHSDTVGQKVIYGFDVMQAPQYKAVVERINDEGGIVMRLEDGFEKVEYSGEIRYLKG